MAGTVRLENGIRQRGEKTFGFREPARDVISLFFERHSGMEPEAGPSLWYGFSLLNIFSAGA